MFEFLFHKVSLKLRVVFFSVLLFPRSFQLLIFEYTRIRLASYPLLAFSLNLAASLRVSSLPFFKVIDSFLFLGIYFQFQSDFISLIINEL